MEQLEQSKPVAPMRVLYQMLLCGFCGVESGRFYNTMSGDCISSCEKCRPIGAEQNIWIWYTPSDIVRAKEAMLVEEAALLAQATEGRG